MTNQFADVQPGVPKIRDQLWFRTFGIFWKSSEIERVGGEMSVFI